MFESWPRTGWLIRHAYSGFELRSALESDLMQSSNVYPVFFDNNRDSKKKVGKFWTKIL